MDAIHDDWYKLAAEVYAKFCATMGRVACVAYQDLPERERIAWVAAAQFAYERGTLGS